MVNWEGERAMGRALLARPKTHKLKDGLRLRDEVNAGLASELVAAVGRRPVDSGSPRQ